MNNRCAFIFALLTKLTVSPQFLLLGHLHDTENIFFFRPVFATKQKTIHCLKWTLMSLCPVTFWYILFFFNSDGKICSWIFRPETPIVWTTIRFLTGSLLLATVSTLAFFIPFLFIFIVSSGNIFFLTGIWNTISHISKLLWGKVTDSWPPVIPHVTIMYGW